MTCRHVWQPLADTSGISQRCVKCHEEKPVGTYEDNLMQTLAYVLSARDEERIGAAVTRMRAWAADHPEADTQGLMDDEWEALARAALDASSAEDTH